jgi:hypothetical protein
MKIVIQPQLGSEQGTSDIAENYVGLKVSYSDIGIDTISISKFVPISA